MRILISNFFWAAFLSLVVGIYFYFRPEIPGFSFLFFGVWAVAFCLDCIITSTKSHLITKHEVNFVFVWLYKVLKSKSYFVQFAIELILITILPVLFLSEFDFVSSSVVAVCLGVSHFVAFYNNVKFDTV